jgi:hypothetical protein
MSCEAKQKTVSLIFLLTFYLLLLCTVSCNTVDLPPDKTVLTLTLEDVSCTEAWIQLTTNNLQLPATLNLLKDNNITKTITLQTADTLLYIDSLLPNQTYNFQAVSQSSNQSSKEINVTTLDTTSHNFTFQTWTFGEHGNSVLFDVAIMGNEIWAVGQIYMNDSLGNPDNKAYNVVHWDGTKWELKRINMLSSCNPITYPPLRAIWAFSENNIVVTSGGSIGWFDGINNLTDCSIRPLLTGSLNKLWGSNSSDLYVVGNNGNIAHWNGSKWTKIESGTDVNLRDISGQTNEIFVSGYSTDLSKSILLKLKNNTTETFWENNTISGTPPYGNLIYSIAGSSNNLIISSNQGVFKHNFMIIYPSQKIFTVPRRVYKVVAKNMNDIYTAGDRSNVWHYNGVTRKELYVNLSVPSPYYSAAVSGNIYVAVGTTVENVIYHQATIIILRRI